MLKEIDEDESPIEWTGVKRRGLVEDAIAKLEGDAKPRAGRCAIIGRPNVGKSTLLNSLLRQKLVIATPRPGTTRSSVLGVYVKDEPKTQIAFVDTPGVARARTPLHRVLVSEAQLGLADADTAILVVEVPKRVGDDIEVHRGDEEAFKLLENFSKPVLLVINKIDRLRDKRELLPFMERYRSLGDFAGILPVSAKSGAQLDELLNELRRHLPEGLLYDEDVLTDRPERFFVAELVREAVFRHTRNEVPYGVAVLIERFHDEGHLIRVGAQIIVEKESHKGIVIGAKGARIKEIGIEARKEIERFLERRVHLGLWVNVQVGWTRDTSKVRALTHSEPPPAF